jgi:hypothetical protein
VRGNKMRTQIGNIQVEEFYLTEKQKEGMKWLHEIVKENWKATGKPCMLIAQIKEDNKCIVSFINNDKAVRVNSIIMEKE